MRLSLDKLAGWLMLVSAIVFAIALATILTAHAFESFGGYLPCHLCLQERYAYYLGVPLAVLAFFVARAEAIGGARLLLLLIAFAANAALGLYHAGVEWKWWAGPSECSGGSTLSFGAGGVDLEHNKIIACDEAAWRFLGLSFAGWNAVVSGVLAGFAAWGAAQKR
jgi:disulfide bond formation protein DsbB